LGATNTLRRDYRKLDVPVCLIAGSDDGVVDINQHGRFLVDGVHLRGSHGQCEWVSRLGRSGAARKANTRRGKS
jgi:hypothetical protein